MQDANFHYTLLVQKPDGTVVPPKVSADGELVIEYVINGAGAVGKHPKRDANFVPVSSAEYNGTVFALLTDPNGRLLTNGMIIS